MKEGYLIFNPEDKPQEELPIIYGFNNNPTPNFHQGVLVAEDGEILGNHICSHEGYMRGDLGILEGSRGDRHEKFEKKYPQGYKMDFVSYQEVEGHKGLNEALRLNKARDNK